MLKARFKIKYLLHFTVIYYVFLQGNISNFSKLGWNVSFDKASSRQSKRKLHSKSLLDITIFHLFEGITISPYKIIRSISSVQKDQHSLGISDKLSANISRIFSRSSSLSMITKHFKILNWCQSQVIFITKDKRLTFNFLCVITLNFEYVIYCSTLNDNNKTPRTLVIGHKLQNRKHENSRDPSATC